MNIVHLDDCHLFVVNGTDEDIKKLQAKIDQLQDEITFKPEEVSATAKSKPTKKPR